MTSQTYFINDVTNVVIGGAFKAFNNEKYEDSIFTVACLFFNCVDFSTLLGTYTKWRSIFTFYFVKEKARMSECSNTKKSLATKVIKTTKTTDFKMTKVQKLPEI